MEWSAKAHNRPWVAVLPHSEGTAYKPYVVKSQYAGGWDGWGRLSHDGPSQYNSGKSEGPWGGGLPHLQGGARPSVWPDTERDNGRRHNVRKRLTQTTDQLGYTESRLKLLGLREGVAHASLPAVSRKTGNVSTIQGRIRASILPDCERPLGISVPTRIS